MHCNFAMMKVAFLLAVAAFFLAENHALPAGKERQREDVVIKCLVEVLSKALPKPDSHPLDQECRDILKAGSKHAPVEKKSEEEVLTHEEEEAKGHEEVPEVNQAETKDIEALLKSLAEKREIPEDERSQEDWGLDDEKEKRHAEEEEEEGGEKEKRIWKPSHRYHHKKHRKRDEELPEDEPDWDRSQESWDLGDDTEKRSLSNDIEKRIWKPSHRYHHKKHRKRDEEPSEEAREELDEERSQESWVKRSDDEEEEDEEREKRGTWKAIAGSHPKIINKKLRKRDEETSEEAGEELDEERSQESWVKRSEDEDEEREKRGTWKAIAGSHPKIINKKLRKRDEETSEEAGEELDEERSQESWVKRSDDEEEEDEEREKRGTWKAIAGTHPKIINKKLRKRGEDASEEESEEREKRIWKPSHRYHHKKHRKRDEEPSEYESDWDRSQESWDLGEDREKRSLGNDIEKRIWKPSHRYHHKKHRKRDEEPSEDESDWERSQESWDLGDDTEKRSLDSGEREKRIWKPSHRYHHKKLRKRDEELSEDEPEWERSQESWDLGDDREKRAEEEDEDREKRQWKALPGPHHKKVINKKLRKRDEERNAEEEEREAALRYLAEKRSALEGHLLREGEVYDKRSPWTYRGYYHPAWWKRNQEGQAVPSQQQLEELAKLLDQVRNEAAGHPEEKRSLSPEEEKELQNLAAMDTELQQIAEKMHANRSE